MVDVYFRLIFFVDKEIEVIEVNWGLFGGKVFNENKIGGGLILNE